MLMYKDILCRLYASLDLMTRAIKNSLAVEFQVVHLLPVQFVPVVTKTLTVVLYMAVPTY